MPKNIFIALVISLSTLALLGCSTASDMLSQHSAHPTPQVMPPPSGDDQLSDNRLWQGSPKVVLDNVSHIPLRKLEAASGSLDPTMNGWIKLVIISKRYSTNSQKLAQQLIAWRNEFATHPANTLLPGDTTLSALMNNAELPQRIALLLPLQGSLGQSGQAVRDGFLSAYYDSFAKTHIEQTISFYDTSQKNIATVYQQAVAEGANVIIGPLMKDNVQTLTRSGRLTIPTLALNYTDVSFGSLPANLYQFGLSPLDEAQQIADKAASATHSRAIIIAPQNDWGHRSVKTLVARWQLLGKTVVDTYYFTPQANLNMDIAKLLRVNTKEDRNKMKEDNNKNALQQQRRQDFDVIFLLAQPQSAREIVPLLKFYYADNIPVYATSSIYAGAPNPTKDQDLRGVIYCDIPWVVHKNHSDRLFAVGHDAYLLSGQLQRLTQLSNFPIYAQTGALTMTASQQIYRRLPWTTIHANKP